MAPDTTGEDAAGGHGAGARRARWVGRCAAALALTVAMLASCADDGRELRPPRPDQTTTTAAPTSTTAPGAVSVGPAPAGLLVSSPAFDEGAPVPERHTCAGADVSPPLSWSEVPEGTAEIAVVVREAGTGVIHWAVSGLPADTGGLAEDTVPEEAAVAVNSFGAPRWDGPCPESGTHYYDVRVYAFDHTLDLPAETPGHEAVTTIEAARPLAVGVLSVTAEPAAGSG